MIPPTPDITAQVHALHALLCSYMDLTKDTSQGRELTETRTYDLESLLSSALFDKERLHTLWMEARVAGGWVYGPVEDETAKVHPWLRPLEDLPELQIHKLELLSQVSQLLTTSSRVGAYTDLPENASPEEILEEFHTLKGYLTSLYKHLHGLPDVLGHQGRTLRTLRRLLAKLCLRPNAPEEVVLFFLREGRASAWEHPTLPAIWAKYKDRPRDLSPEENPGVRTTFGYLLGLSNYAGLGTHAPYPKEPPAHLSPLHQEIWKVLFENQHFTGKTP